MIAICDFCKKEFNTKPSRKRKCCSRKCAIAHRRPIVLIIKCIQCGNETSNPKFCNSSCAAIYNNSNRGKSSRIKQQKTLIKTLATIKHSFPERKNQAIHKYYQNPKYCVICNKLLPYPGRQKSCSKQCKSKLMSQIMSASTHRRLMRHTTKFIKNNGETVLLDSSFELKVATELEKYNITWCRPKPFSYSMNNKCHNYFPDFYLPDYDVYLDPKNDFLIKTQSEKIHIIRNTYKIKLLILNSEQLTWNKIKSIIDFGACG